MPPVEEKTRNGILCTLSVNPPRKQRMSFRQRSVTYVKGFLRAFTREKRYPTCFKFRFVSSPLTSTMLSLKAFISCKRTVLTRLDKQSLTGLNEFDNLVGLEW